MRALGWPSQIFAQVRKINHFLIAQFDQSRVQYCFLWAPICFAYVVVVISVGISTLLHWQEYLVLTAFLPFAFALLFHAMIIFFLTGFLCGQAYFGMSVRAGMPVFAKGEQFFEELVGIFREGRKPRSGSNAEF